MTICLVVHVLTKGSHGPEIPFPSLLAIKHGQGFLEIPLPRDLVWSLSAPGTLSFYTYRLEHAISFS